MWKTGGECRIWELKNGGSPLPPAIHLWKTPQGLPDIGQRHCTDAICCGQACCDTLRLFVRKQPRTRITFGLYSVFEGPPASHLSVVQAGQGTAEGPARLW